jgi:hypothetical protein
MVKNLNFYRVFLIFVLAFLLKDYENSLCAEEVALIHPRREFEIAIFKEEGFPAIATPRLLTPEWLYNTLGKDFSITYLNSSQLKNNKYFNPDNFDLLILPYGEAFPYEEFSSIKEYLFKGGGLFNIAGRPFWAALEKTDGRWNNVVISDPYKEFLSPLGIKYYEFIDKQDIGLSVTTSLNACPVNPTHGNVFPYRIPCREFFSLGYLGNEGPLNSSVLVKSWRNPYKNDSGIIPQKWCLIGAKADRHPLDPQNDYAKDNLIKIIDYLKFPLILYGLETDLAAYRQHEPVKILAKIANGGREREYCSVEFELVGKDGKVVYKKERSVGLKSLEAATLEVTWQPGGFESAFYKVRAILKHNGKIYDKEENGFVIINENILKSGPSMNTKGRGFIIGGKTAYILGTNYYESKEGELIWVRPNILKIKEDFKSMRDLGMNFVRIHYHHSKWFRDYFSQVIKENLDSYLQNADVTVLPSERSLRILDAIIQLAQEQGLIFCTDIFSLVPKEMGNPVGWLGLKERIIDKKKMALQKKFIKLIANRYKDIPGITWDLWNEPRLQETDYDLLRGWAKEIKKTFRENGDTHLVTIGDDLSLKLLDVLDYASIHTYEPGDFVSIKDIEKPFIFQEVWNEAGCSLNEEIKQTEELKKDFNYFLKTQAGGFVPWQWTRQARFWNNNSEAERWDDELGLFARDDGSLKPAAGVYTVLLDQIRKK